MCESTVVIDKDGSEEEVMRDVVKIYVNDDTVVCMDVTGTTNEFKNVKVAVIDSLKHYIVLKAI